MQITRTPRLLWRYLASDVLGILLLTAGGLVGIIAFAASMRPLSEGRVGPFDAVRLMGLLAVPMLQFALPFAAGLASTLAYHRFAAENEAAASMAGGISHRSILAPAVMIGAALSILLGLLSHQVIPRFLRDAEQLITRDVTRFIVQPIERGETVQIGNWDIRADQVVDAGAAARLGRSGDAAAAPEGGVVPVEHLVMRGVLAHRVDRPDRFIDADRVDLWLYEDAPASAEEAVSDEEGGTRAVLRFNRANAFVGADQLQAQGAFTDSLRIPSAFRDDPKFLDFNELRRVREHPEMLNRVERRRRLVAEHLAMRDMLRDVNEQLAATGRAVLLRRGDTLTIHASGTAPSDDGWTLLPPAGSKRVRVDVKLASGTPRTHTASSARLRFRDLAPIQAGLEDSGEQGGRVWLRLDLEDVATSGGAGGGGSSGGDGALNTRSEVQQYSALTTEKDHSGVRLAQPSRQLIESADALLAAAPTGGTSASRSKSATDFRRAVRDLDSKIEDLRLEATSKLHERAAFSLSCLLMVLCGSVVALRLQTALPLQVYLWSFFPALLCVITISAGQRLTHRLGGEGLLLLWGGVAALGVYTAAAYASLRRH